MQRINKGIGCLLMCWLMVLSGMARAQTVLASDPFNTTSATLSGRVSPGTGAGTWSIVNTIDNSSTVSATTGEYPTVAGLGLYKISTALGTNDYTVSTDFVCQTNGGAAAAPYFQQGIAGRIQTNGDCYLLRFVSANGSNLPAWQLTKGSSSLTVATPIQADISVSGGLVVGHTYHLTLKVQATAITATYVDSTLGGATTTMSGTDGSLTTGAAGVVSYGAATSSTGFHLLNWSVSSLAASNVIVYADGTSSAGGANSWLRSPYNHSISGTGVSSVDTTVNTGSYQSTVCTGVTSTPVLSFTTSNLTGTFPVIAYRWDNGTWIRVTVAATVTISAPVGASVNHLLEWCYVSADTSQNRWTGAIPATALQFTGMTCNTGSSFAAPVARPKIIVVWATSIGEGRAAIVASNDSFGGTTVSDATLAWPFLLRDETNAEVCVKSWSGQGDLTVGQGSVPSLLSSYSLLWATQSITYSPQPDLCILDMGQNDGSAIPTSANMQTIANGINAKKTLFMGDQSGYATSIYQAAATALGTRAAYGTPASVLAGSSVGSTGPTADSYDGVHLTATAHKLKWLSAVVVPAYQLLYNTGTGAIRPVKGGPVHK